VVSAALLAAGCGGRPSAAPPSAAPPSPSLVPAAAPPVILCVGTSLTAGFGLDPEVAFPALLQAKVDAAGLRYRVVNGGVSGETSAGALRRLDWLLREPVAVLILESGANDGLRGQDPEALRKNLQAAIDRARRQEPPPRILLVGMKAPPNYGADYTRRFEAVYADLAAANRLPLVPFLLDRVAGVASLNQADGIHPTADGQRLVAENVWKVLEPMLRGGADARSAAVLK
jgi:acyl-CoA thioesterase-1